MDKVTTCKDCGKTIEYKTKKPKLCKECHEKRYGNRKFYYKPGDTPQKSKGEFFLNKTLNELLPEASYIDGGYYSFMLSPKGYPMQLDRYYPRLHLAFEYDGKQHDKDTELFFRTEKGFLYQQKCDQLKESICKANKITIIRIKHDEYITKNLIIEKLKASNIFDYICAQTKINL